MAGLKKAGKQQDRFVKGPNLALIQHNGKQCTHAKHAKLMFPG